MVRKPTQTQCFELSNEWSWLRRKPAYGLRRDVVNADEPTRGREGIRYLGITGLLDCKHSGLTVNERVIAPGGAMSPATGACSSRVGVCQRRILSHDMDELDLFQQEGSLPSELMIGWIRLDHRRELRKGVIP